MTDPEVEPTETPATWENVVVGKAIESLGHVLGNEDATEEGEAQVDAAHEVREEYVEEHQHGHHEH